MPQADGTASSGRDLDESRGDGPRNFSLERNFFVKIA